MTLNAKEQKRLFVLNRVIGKELTAVEAATLLELSERQLRRILAAYREEGVAALAHGNRGRQPAHTIDASVRRQVVELAATKYAGTNHQHLSELLSEHEQITLSRSTVRRIREAVGQPSPKKRRPAKHRRRRERYPQEGMLFQVDGSQHRWLEERGPMLTLIAFIDDATGKVLGALFREQEDAHGYFLVLQQLVTHHGRPLAIYRDRHSIFEPSMGKTETIAEQLEGKRAPTQFGRLLEELEITSIGAHSPQAKGRVERLFGTFQDRLVVELRLANAATLEEANAVLTDFLPRFNAQFAVEAAEAGMAYRPLPDNLRPKEVFCFKYVRTVAADNTVTFGEQRIQLFPSKERVSYARARVEVHERLDGSVAVYHDGTCLAITEAPKEAAALRARKGARTPLSKGATRSVLGAPLPPDAPSPRPEPDDEPGPRPANKPPPSHPWRKPIKQARMSNSLTT